MIFNLKKLFIGSTAKNGFQIRIAQEKIHNIKEKKGLFYMTLKENITKISCLSIDWYYLQHHTLPIPPRHFFSFCSYFVVIAIRQIISIAFVAFMWLIEVIFLLEFYYLLFIFIFVSYLGSMMPPCRHSVITRRN